MAIDVVAVLVVLRSSRWWINIVPVLFTIDHNVIGSFAGNGNASVPAYVNVALLMGPLLVGLGIATFTAHMFIFYFAVASAITPPVALAAFAASTITKAEPMATGFSAVRSGIVMFAIPFVLRFTQSYCWWIKP